MKNRNNEGQFLVSSFPFSNQEIDLTDVEAARYMHAKKKDHLKFIIESKNIMDFIVKNSVALNLVLLFYTYAVSFHF